MTRIGLNDISSTAWEHPADRAALNTLRAIPGFDEVITRIAGFIGDRVLQILNTVMRDHPFATVRAGELQRWIDSGGYERIVAGAYARRADVKTGPTTFQKDFDDASEYYGDQAKAALEKLTDGVGRAKGAFDDAFRGAAR